MKKTLLFTISMLLFTLISSAQAFVTTWTTINGQNYISFEATTTGSVSYSWETVPPSASGSGTFTGPNVTIGGLPTNQTIRLSIQPTNFKRFKSVNGIYFYTLNSVSQWGAVEWQSMESAFKDNQGLQVTATDLPNLSNVTSMANMFENCVLLDSPFNINFWNISNVTNLSGMFKDCFNFNQALSQWNTTNVTNMSSLFEYAKAFNQNIGTWDTSNVTNMSKMFAAAQFFDRNIGNWDTSNVTDMSNMFSYEGNFTFPTLFNKNIGNWNTANVTNMSGMFRGAELFNRNIGNWDTSNVTNMSEMFKDALSFDQNLGAWNTSNVTNMAGMFSNEIFNNIPENYLFNNAGSSSIENWNTSNVVDMSAMFSRATNFNHNLGNWSLAENEDLSNMLDRSGLDCRNYSNTLIGWNNNPNTPNNRILGATFMEYGPEAIPAIDNMVLNKGWGFSGHDFLSTIPEFNIDINYCEGDVIPPLPTVSIEGITGSWTPELDSTQTTTYTFTPNEGECALSTTLTIFIDPSTTPIFTQVPAICAGETLNDLPTTSNNGINGSWSPEINNTATTTYTFTPSGGVCATTVTMTITVNTSATTPSFAQVPEICAGETLSALPTTSVNGIVGTWSPELDNTATTTYTFTPNDGQCATTATMTITVNPTIIPTFTEVPDICAGETLSPLPTTSNNGITGTWSPALNNTTTTTYTFTPNGGQCATITTLTIIINPIVAPAFTQVPAICAGEPLAPLPTTSNNGITGTWSPAINNTATTLYTFTPDAGQCATTATMTITVNTTIVTPTFTQVPAICEGETLTALPTTSNNGIVGAWSPALNNTATTTYTFLPNDGQCAETATMTITVNPSITPIFTQVPAICEGETLTELPTTSNNGIIGSWAPALNNTATTTYTFTPTTGDCVTTTTMTIIVNPTITPTFTQVAAICIGDTLTELPTTSNNGIIGTWSPALNNTATTTYTFTPNGGQCATTATMTIIVNPIVAPTFTQVPAICAGETLSALPTTSNNGIIGTWSPALNNSETTTYTFSPNDGQCATTATMTIIVNPIVAPTFTQVPAICTGETLNALPTTSNNGIVGTWSPALNNTETTTYTFTPNDGQCAILATMTITVNTIESPTGEAEQTVTPGDTIADIVISPTNVLWYATIEDALNNVNPLPSSFPLEDEATYFAVNDDGECRSEPFAVTVFFTLSVGNNDFLNLNYYPNPVSSVLYISNNIPINQVEIYNLLGQQLMKKDFSAANISIDLSLLPESIYLIKIKTGNQSNVFKIIKQ